MLKVLDLFSGIGGFSLGLRMAGGFETVGFCEIDRFCQKVLEKNFPGVPIYSDIKSINHNGTVDVITGGYPCQPFSEAGLRKGEEDHRHLWPEMLNVIRGKRPDWVIAENVAGHVSLGLDNVLSDLEACGYTCQSFVIPACAVGAQHRRDRVWAIANANGKQLRDTKKQKFNKIQALTRDNCAPGAMADTASSDDGTRNREKDRGQKQQLGKRCFESWRPWPVEPGMGRVVDGLSGGVDFARERNRALGNAVVPRIVEIIGNAIKEIETNSHEIRTDSS